MNASVLSWQWVMLILSSLILIFVSPIASSAQDFFRGSKNDTAPGYLKLTASLVISWLFAKSITNAANLGLSFGIVGGVAYSVYYLSFIVAGWIIFKMRTQGAFTSIHDFLSKKFGSTALAIFSLLIAFRLINEIWSNTMVIGTYFGAEGSAGYYGSIVLFTLLTMTYTIKGGLRSSLLTDLIQMVLFGLLLFGILAVILPQPDVSIRGFIVSGHWTLAGGVNLLLVALIQIFSYPFHDPVMTDRAFITKPRVMLSSFIAAGLIGGICIILFSFVGIFAHQKGLTGQAPVEVAKLLGTGMMLMINYIMITSAASTIDSAFNSFSKLTVIDLHLFKAPNIRSGRLAILIIMVLGSIPVFLGAEILTATTISGTMVLGLTPVFLFWSDRAGPQSFNFAVLGGVCIGIIYAFGYDFGNPIPGKYGDLLWVNLIGLLTGIILYFAPVISNKLRLQ